MLKDQALIADLKADTVKEIKELRNQCPEMLPDQQSRKEFGRKRPRRNVPHEVIDLVEEGGDIPDGESADERVAFAQLKIYMKDEQLRPMQQMSLNPFPLDAGFYKKNFVLAMFKWNGGWSLIKVEKPTTDAVRKYHPRETASMQRGTSASSNQRS